MDSHYNELAEYHELFMPPAWDRLRRVIEEAFCGIGSDGVIADIGAGSGLGTAMVAEVSDAEILALEPNTTMRSMMVARLDNAGVLDRVTLLPEPVPEGLEQLPDQVDGVIAAHMLGHLAKPSQVRLLDWIAASLAPSASALITVDATTHLEPTEPVVEERTVGRFRYRATHRRPGPGRYEGLFEVVDRQQRVVRSAQEAISWDSVTVGGLREMLVDHPVEVTEPLPGVALVSQPR